MEDTEGPNKWSDRGSFTVEAESNTQMLQKVRICMLCAVLGVFGIFLGAIFLLLHCSQQKE